MNWISITAISSLTLAACSGSEGALSGGSGPAPGPSSLRVEEFSVQGTSTTLLGGAAVIDASENNGRFSISWQVNASPPYELHARVSKDAAPYTGDDLKFLNISCAESSACPSASSIDCQFNNQNRLQCIGQPAIDLTNWFDSLPQDAYMLFEACHPKECSGKSAPVQFR